MTVSIILIALGAILAFAVTVTTRGLDLTTVGVILMVVGFGGWLTSLMVDDALTRRRPWSRRSRESLDELDEIGERRTIIR